MAAQNRAAFFRRRWDRGDGMGGGGTGVVVVSDSFNRADNAASLGNADTGQTWVQLDVPTGAFGILTNQGVLAYVSGVRGQDSVAYIDSLISDGTFQITIPISPSGSGFQAALGFRIQDGTNFLSFGANSTTNYQVHQCLAGATTNLGSSTGITPAAGDVLRVVALGSTVNAYVNGALAVGPLTITNFQTATKHGLYSATNNGNAACVWDNFSVAH